MMCHAGDVAHAAHAASYVLDPSVRDGQDVQPWVQDLKLLSG
jgi:hypothetical protein